MDTVPVYPAAADVPPGSLLLVRLDDEPGTREVKKLRSGTTRVDLAVRWEQKGEVFWLLDLEPLERKAANIVEAMLITPNAPFGDVSQLVWTDLLPEEKERLYWGALQALAARPSFEAAVADAWVRASFAYDRAEGEQKGHARLVHRLRKSALDEAKARILARFESEVDLPALTKGIDATALVRQHLRDTGWQGAHGPLMAAVRRYVDEQLETAVSAELDARLGEVFAYIRKGVGLTLNGALAKLGTPKGGDNGA